MKISLLLDPANSQCQAFQRFMPELARRGCEFVGELHDAPELYIAHHSRLPDDLVHFKAGTPYILLESTDGAQLRSQTRSLLRSNNPPAAVWKVAVYSRRKLYNEWHGRYHTLRCAQAGLGEAMGKPDPPAIPEDRLQRISSPFGFESYPRCQEVLALIGDRWKNRERGIDVSFAGTVSYDGTIIEKHRLACCDAIERLGGCIAACIPGRTLDTERYVELLLLSKVVVSPYGWGEFCLRDFEALFAGCILIKPKVDHCECTFRHISAAVNFANLSYAVNEALKLCADNKFAESQRESLLSIYTPNIVAERMMLDISRAVNCSTE